MHLSHAGPDASRLVVEVSRERASSNFHKAEVEEWVRLRDDFEGEPIRESEWKPVEIPVAEQRIEFQMIRGEDERWGAMSIRGGLVLKVEAERFPVEDVSLVEVLDVEPYLRGQDELLASLRA